MCFHLPYFRKLCQCLCEHKCSVLFFQLSYNSLSGGYGLGEACLIPAETLSHWGCWEASGLLSIYFYFLFFCLDVKEKKVQYLNPFGLSHVQDSICMSRSHVIIPSFFLSLFSLCSLPPSRSTAPGRLFPLAPTAHCATYTTQSRVEVI